MGKVRVKKLKASELTEVKEQQEKLNNLLLNIGNAEAVKSQLVSQHLELQNAWNKLTVDLEKKYGQVNISLVDGTLTPVEEKGLAKV
jgi:hypothetical protein|tara:strand:+ start:467 stop:727 length:261 start_codon:yes stop_codon:yes gene_type:complete